MPGELALALLVLRILAENPDHPLAADDLALVTHAFDRRSHLHDTLSPILIIQVDR